MITNQKKWDEYVEKNKDPYGKGCVDVAREVMELLDKSDDFDPDDLISKAPSSEGMTGFMAGAVASMVSQCHSRGEEFRNKWNKSYGVDETKDKGGTVNPALITIDVDKLDAK